MTRLAANIDLVIRGLIAACAGIVALHYIGAVTLSTTAIPVVVDAGPVKRAIRRDGVLAFVDMIPALTSFDCFTAVPGDT